MRLETSRRLVTRRQNDGILAKICRHHEHCTVLWKGYPLHESTWEPERNLDNCDALLSAYKHTHGLWDPLWLGACGDTSGDRRGWCGVLILYLILRLHYIYSQLYYVLGCHCLSLFSIFEWVVSVLWSLNPYLSPSWTMSWVSWLLGSLSTLPYGAGPYLTLTPIPNNQDLLALTQICILWTFWTLPQSMLPASRQAHQWCMMHGTLQNASLELALKLHRNYRTIRGAYVSEEHSTFTSTSCI